MTCVTAIEWPLNLVDEDDRDDPPDTIASLDQPLKIWKAALLGQGSVGRVFAGMMGEQRIAAKLFNRVFTLRQLRDLDNEVRGWSSLQHARVLPYLGKCALGFGLVALLSPYMENGNLMDFITKYPNEDRLGLLQQVAEGVHYLHTDAHMVHGNLKCTNILVSGNRTALLGDFALSTVAMKLEQDDPTSTYIRIRHTAPFAAPELFNDRAMQAIPDTDKLMKRSKTMHSDVYAFGMLIYEVMTATTPWATCAPDKISGSVLAGERPPRTLQFSNELWNMCESCWAQDPFTRPNIAEVLTTISSLVSAGH